MPKRLIFLLMLSWCMVTPAGAANYEKLFKSVDPAVVVIYTQERGISLVQPSGFVSEAGLGSGVLVDNEGHVVTAAHVVQTADLVEVEFANGFKTTAAVTASDPDKDLALLALDELPEGIRPASLVNSNDVEIGQEVFVIGAPYGFSHTLSVGRISGRHSPGEGSFEGPVAETLQTDAVINQGNSGGPLFNEKGEVIGIVSYILSKSGGFEGLGFAITSNEVIRTLLEQPMAWSGMSGIVLDGRLAALFNVPQQSGFLVQKIALNSPAANAGLQPSVVPAIIAGRELLIGGDIILSVDGMEISPTMVTELRARQTSRGGRVVPLKILRHGKVMEITVSLPR